MRVPSQFKESAVPDNTHPNVRASALKRYVVWLYGQYIEKQLLVEFLTRFLLVKESKP